MTFVPRTVRTVEDLDEMVEAYLQFDAFAFDLETKSDGRHERTAGIPRYARITWLSFAGPGRTDAIPVAHEHGEVEVPAHKEQYYVPDPKGGVYKSGPRKGQPRTLTRTRTVPATYYPPPEQLSVGTVIERLRPLFLSDERVKVAHNAKFDMSIMARYFREQIPQPWGDTIILHHLLNENLLSLRLGDMTSKLYGTKYAKIGGSQPHLHAFSEAASYALRDAAWTWALWSQYRGGLEEQGLEAVFKLEMECLEAVVDMEYSGVPVDLAAMRDLSVTLQRDMEALEVDIVKEAGKVLNLNAAADKSWYVYEHCNHQPFSFTTKTKQPSTKASVLEAYARRDQRVRMLMDWSDLQKLRSVYAEGLAEHVINGRIHGSFLPWGTVTGRFSSASPNLQNIPRLADADDASAAARGRLIRKLFVAPPEWVIVGADYDQIEYRVLAHVAQDRKMIDAFNAGIDPHTATAASLLGKEHVDVSPGERSLGKTINFAMLYGAGPGKVADTAKISETKARVYIERFWKEYPDTTEWKKELLADARRQRPPGIRTLFGRKRRLPELFWADDGERSRAERQAVNSCIQGGSADIIKMAMVKFHRLSQGTPHQLVMTVHDELIVLSPEKDAQEGCEMLEEAMAGDQFLDVPLVAEASFSDNWGDAK